MGMCACRQDKVLHLFPFRPRQHSLGYCAELTAGTSGYISCSHVAPVLSTMHKSSIGATVPQPVTCMVQPPSSELAAQHGCVPVLSIFLSHP